MKWTTSLTLNTVDEMDHFAYPEYSPRIQSMKWTTLLTPNTVDEMDHREAIHLEGLRGAHRDTWSERKYTLKNGPNLTPVFSYFKNRTDRILPSFFYVEENVGPNGFSGFLKMKKTQTDQIMCV